MREHEVDVVVVGAGPTGATVAGLLGRRGLSVAVLERRTAVHPLPRAVHFDDEVLRTFTGMGLGPAVRAVSTPGLGMRLITPAGAVLAELPRDPTGGSDGLPEANMFHQPDLERVLRQDLGRWPNVQLRTDVEVLGVHQDEPDRVRVRVRDARCAATMTAGAVLACDGASSGVRRQLGIDMVELGQAQTWLVVDVRTARELDQWRGVHQVCDHHRGATFMRVGPQRYRWEFALRRGETEQQLAEPAVLQALLAPWLAAQPRQDWELVRCTAYTFRARVAQRWRHGRTLLLGDAAHQTPPFLGQGMCAGIRDAANLEWKLALVLRGAADVAVLDSYEQERRPHVTHVIRTAVALGQVITAGGPVTTAARSALLRGASQVPGLTQRLTRQAWPTLPPGPLARRPPRRAPWRPPWRNSVVGSLVPTPEVRTIAGVRRLDEVLGSGFAVLVAGEHAVAAGLPEALDARWLRVLGGVPRAPTDVQDVDGVLTRWLARAGARAVLLRPDRIVLLQDTQVDAVGWGAQLRRAGLGG